MPKPQGEQKMMSPSFIELQHIEDLGRLTCALERVPIPVFAIPAEGSIFLAAHLDLFMGTPVFYFARTKEAKQFLAYRTIGASEEVSQKEGAEDSGFAFTPLIGIKRLPKFYQDGLAGNLKLNVVPAMEMDDLSSLAKICSYKTLYEESPLPVFSFSAGSENIIGTFTRMNEYEDSIVFFFCRLSEAPTQNFIRYSPRRGEETAFTNRLDEHGFSFIKVIRLIKSHPFADI